MIDALEATPVERAAPVFKPSSAGINIPKNLFKGEVFCTRYGINIECLKTRASLFDILFELDGKKSVGEIAERCHTTKDTVETVITELRRHGLVDMDAHFSTGLKR
jgi:hypothetical protein